MQYILDSVIAELQEDSKRRFSYAETGFFWTWWMMQHDIVRHQVKKLVDDGKITENLFLLNFFLNFNV